MPKSQRIKIIDYGNAILKEDFNDSTINTRQFRAPEVILSILGLTKEPAKWDHKSDIWSIGCILMELFTGKILFPTSSTYEHILMMEKTCGSTFPLKLVEEIRNKEVQPLFDLNKEAGHTGSFVLQSHELKEKVDLTGLRRQQTIDVE